VIHVTGMESVLAGFAKDRGRDRDRRGRGARGGGQAIKAAWQRNIEADGLVDTGRYLDSITVERDGMHVKVGSDVPYGPILEYGDSRQAAHPVGERAVDEHGEDAIGAVSSHLERVVR
jgi:phage gpG-like protein